MSTWIEDGVRDLALAATAQHTRTFAIASRFLPAETSDLAVVLYAYLRRAGDAIDFAHDQELEARIDALRAEIEAVYAGRDLSDPLTAGFQMLVHTRAIPRIYADELIAGLALDALGSSYDSQRDLLHHCGRVAGTVGMMMCHVMGVRDDRALPHAAHLGIAMQLTNVCRDVLEDWERGRLYLPAELLASCGATQFADAQGGPLPARAVPGVARAIGGLLDVAELYYASADAGIAHLTPRCALAVRTARLLYSEIGAVIRKRGCDPRARRAAVPARIKMVLAARAGASMLSALSAEASGAAGRLPRTVIGDIRSVLQVLPARVHGGVTESEARY
jgi:phytoene synthase